MDVGKQGKLAVITRNKIKRRGGTHNMHDEKRRGREVARYLFIAWAMILVATIGAHTGKEYVRYALVLPRCRI